MKSFFGRVTNQRTSSRSSLYLPIIFKQRSRLLLLFISSVLVVGLLTPVVQAQNSLKSLEEQQIKQFALPKVQQQTPVYKPRPVSAPVLNKSSQRRVQQDIPAVSESPRRSVRRPVQVDDTPEPVRVVKPEPKRDSEIEKKQEELKQEQEISVADNSPLGQHVLTFNRSPVVGNGFRLQGFYSTARLGFPRPRSWKVASAKALIRFQHSPALIASRSNLTVFINGISVGSVPLNRAASQVGQVAFSIPPERLQDYNEISVVAQQHNSTNCKEEKSDDPTLWTEILPDSKLIFDYRTKPVPLDFARYPYPFFDSQSLEPNLIAYLQPQKISQSWLTASARYSAALGRIAEYRSLDTRLVKGVKDVEANERLVVIGTPEEQPELKSLNLPFKIASNQVLDGDRNPLPPDVGVLMMTTTQDNGVPVLVATGNGAEGVAKAVQFLVQSQEQQIGTGKALLVTNITDTSTPSPRKWSGYLPEKNSFKLSDLKIHNQPFQDITVRGSGAPPIEFDFKALPDDRFNRGSSMTLSYSYGPQVNPRTSAVEVLIDGVYIGGDRLTDERGATRKTVNVNLPPNLIKPTSKMQVMFRLNPKEPATCGKVNDQQLMGTLHTDTSFHLNRENSVVLPDLKLLQHGYPFTAPQDLSSTAIVLPDAPTSTDLMTLLEFSERLGRLSQADSVKLNVYTTGTFPTEERKKVNLVGIGVRDKLPFPEVFQSANGFKLNNLFSRQWGIASVQALPDGEGVIKEIVSPWKSDRVVLALTGQTEGGVDKVRQLLGRDPWFYQLKGDTGLISTNESNSSPYDPDSYSFEFLQQTQPERIDKTNFLSKISRWLQDYWFVLPTAIVTVALILYGISQLYLKKITDINQ